MRTVDVEIRTPADIGGLERATVYARLVDVSVAGAPARTVAESVLRDVRVWPDSTLRARIELPEEAFDSRADYNVRALVERRGDARAEPGDLVSTEIHPVLTYGRPSRVAVPLKLVSR